MGALAKAGDLNPQTARQALALATVVSTFCIEKFSLERLCEIGVQDIQERYEAYRKMLAIEPLGE
jgi:hypothetical protein